LGTLFSPKKKKKRKRKSKVWYSVEISLEEEDFGHGTSSEGELLEISEGFRHWNSRQNLMKFTLET
jgi:hypothetical protein